MNTSQTRSLPYIPFPRDPCSGRHKVLSPSLLRLQDGCNLVASTTIPESVQGNVGLIQSPTCSPLIPPPSSPAISQLNPAISDDHQQAGFSYGLQRLPTLKPKISEMRSASSFGVTPGRVLVVAFRESRRGYFFGNRRTDYFCLYMNVVNFTVYIIVLSTSIVGIGK